MDEEAARIDVKLHHTADEGEGDTGEQHRQYQQHEIDFLQVMMHLIGQVFLISHIGHLWVFLHLHYNPLERITVDIVCLQPYLQGGRKGIETQKFRRVGTHCQGLLTLGLFLADIVNLERIGPVVKVTTKTVSLIDTHIIIEHDGHRQMLLNVGREVSRCEHREHYKAQQNQHQSGTDTQCYNLQTLLAAGAFSFLSHCFWI